MWVSLYLGGTAGRREVLVGVDGCGCHCVWGGTVGSDSCWGVGERCWWVLTVVGVTVSGWDCW